MIYSLLLDLFTTYFSSSSLSNKHFQLVNQFYHNYVTFQREQSYHMLTIVCSAHFRNPKKSAEYSKNVTGAEFKDRNCRNFVYTNIGWEW